MGGVYSVLTPDTRRVCSICATPLRPSSHWNGARRKYCSDSCKQKAWHRRWPTKARLNGLKFRASHPDWMRTRLLRGYGLTGEQYEALLTTQGGVCAICGRPEEKRHRNGTIYSLGVDHDHLTGAVRGLLCRECNRGIGDFGDDAERVEAAADYLRRYK